MLARELAVALRAAIEAGTLVRTRRRTGLTVDYKAPDAPVTCADRASSALIVDALRAAFPADAVVSEEAAPPAHIAPRTWFVDPLDGTHAYIAGDDGYCIQIGLVAGGVPILGVIALPEHDLVLYADDAGAWSRTAGAVAPLRTSDLADLTCARRGSGSRSIGVRLARLAAGEADLYVNPSARCRTWDTAAGHAIVERAAGAITDLCGRPLRYDSLSSVHVQGVLASNGTLHAAALAALASR